jgi:uncharacterized protein YdbL (DUF1318 family)
MWQRTLLMATLLVSACVTVNIYFPAAAVERAADQIVKETWGGPGQPPKKNEPQSRMPSIPQSIGSWSLVPPAYAQEADINVSNPAIRALKDSIKNRSDLIKPFMDRGSVGINQDGLLAIRTTDGLSLKERAEVQQLVEAENRDREALYLEIAKANNFARDAVPKIKRIFAKSWADQARPGWWIQDAQGAWRRK